MLSPNVPCGSLYRSGVPTLTECSESLSGPTYHAVESFSDRFVANAKRLLGRQAIDRELASVDPLHQWSRRWEYPFCVCQLQEHLSRQGASLVGEEISPRLLDAGSGFTFFPFFLSGQGWNVIASDIDRRLGRLYEGINSLGGPSFQACDLVNLPFSRGFFDAVVCVSVLEHSPERKRILEELFRVLRKGGLLVLTLDISLDGKADISVDRSLALMDVLAQMFSTDLSQVVNQIRALIENSEEYLTTMWAREHAPYLLPWRLTTAERMRGLARFRWRHPMFYRLAVLCLALTKPS